MTRSSVNFIVDLFVALLFLATLSVESIVHFIFPAPSNANGWTLWGMGLDAWNQLEVIVSCVFAVSVLIHVILHWTWVCGFITARISNWRGRTIRLSPSARTLYGVSFLILVLTMLAGVYAAASFGVTAPGGP